MAVNLIDGVFLMMLCSFSYVFGELCITKAQFKDFKGEDPTTHCGCTKSMSDECNKLGESQKVTNGKTTQIKGFPHCDTPAAEFKDGQQNVKILACAWDEGQFFFVGKGQTPGHYMNYLTDNDGILHPNLDLKYPKC